MTPLFWRMIIDTAAQQRLAAHSCRLRSAGCAVRTSFRRVSGPDRPTEGPGLSGLPGDREKARAQVDSGRGSRCALTPPRHPLGEMRQPWRFCPPRNLQRLHAPSRWRQVQLPLEGRPRAEPAPTIDARVRGVHLPLPAAPLGLRLPPGSPRRPARQLPPQEEASSMPPSAEEPSTDYRD